MQFWPLMTTPIPSQCLAETIYVLTNNYFFSCHCLTMLMAVVPIKLTVCYYGDQYLANMLVTISRLDTSLPSIRINNRKLTTKLWLLSKLFRKVLNPQNYIILAAAMLYSVTAVNLTSPIPYNLVTLAVNCSITYVWFTNLFGIVFSIGLIFYLTLSMAQLRFKQIIHLVKVTNHAAMFNVIHLYNKLIIDIQLCRPLFDALIGIVYVSVPYFIAVLAQLLFDGYWFARTIAASGMTIVCICNYSIYHMASSICMMNDIIVKLLYPIQFDKRPKTRQIKLKIDSFINRLNEEFVGFYCLYAIKFTRMSFYQYILGISTTYFLVKGLVNGRQG